MAYTADEIATAQIAHDFNNLLSVISGNASLLEGLVDDHPQGTLVQEILKASARGEALVRQLLVQTRSRKSNFEHAALNATIERTIHQLGPILGDHIDVTTDLSESVRFVAIGHSELERCISNLLLNAGDAMPDGGQIWIETRSVLVAEMRDSSPGLRPGSYGVMAVEDTGHGMSPEVQEHIFQPFYSTRGAGRGLGLAWIFGMVREIGGYIDAKSRQGSGSTFELYLPLS